MYTTNLNKLYDKEIKDFMESVKQHMYHPRSDRKGIAGNTISESSAKNNVMFTCSANS